MIDARMPPLNNAYMVVSNPSSTSLTTFVLFPPGLHGSINGARYE